LFLLFGISKDGIHSSSPLDLDDINEAAKLTLTRLTWLDCIDKAHLTWMAYWWGSLDLMATTTAPMTWMASTMANMARMASTTYGSHGSDGFDDGLLLGLDGILGEAHLIRPHQLSIHNSSPLDLDGMEEAANLTWLHQRGWLTLDALTRLKSNDSKIKQKAS
jgi:hypothetical protein